MHNIENNDHFTRLHSKSFEQVNWKNNYNTRHSFKGNYVLLKIRTETGKISSLLGNENLATNSTGYEIKHLLLFKKKYANHFISNSVIQTHDACNLWMYSRVIQQRLLKLYL